MSRRTGRLVLLPQFVLADLETGLPAEVIEELRSRVVPWIRGLVDTSSAAMIGGALVDLREDDVAVLIEEEPGGGEETANDPVKRVFSGGPFLPYNVLNCSRGVLRAVARVHVRGEAGSCRLAGPEVEGGGGYVFDGDEDGWCHARIPARELLTPVARTFGLELELTSGGLAKCTAVPATANMALPDRDDALARLSTRLRPRVEALIGGASLLARDPLAGIAILVTSLSAFLARPELSRKDKKDRPCVRADLYEALLDSLDLGEDRETIRRIVEGHHPHHIELQVHWPSGATGEANRSATLLGRRGEHLVQWEGHILAKASPLPDPSLGLPLVRGLTEMDVLKSGISPRSPDLLSRSSYEGEREEVGGISSPVGSSTLAGGPSGPLGTAYRTGGFGNHADEGTPPVIPAPRKAVAPKAGPSSGLPAAWFSPEAVEDVAWYQQQLQPGMLNELLASAPTGTALGLVEREARRMGAVGTKELLASMRGLKADAVHKYVDAASKLESYLPGCYAEALHAILSGKPLPSLPSASRLKLIPGFTVGLRGEELTKKIEYLLLSPVPESILRELEQPASTDPRVRMELRLLDKLQQLLTKAEASLKYLALRAGEGALPLANVVKVVSEIAEQSERLTRAATDARSILVDEKHSHHANGS